MGSKGNIEDLPKRNKIPKRRIILLQGEEETFQTHIKKIRHKGRQYALLANAAYKRGDYAEAERLGTLAISHSRELKKWILAKAKEVQETNPTRELYF